MINSEETRAVPSTAPSAPVLVQMRPVTAYEITVNGNKLFGVFVQEAEMDGIKRLASDGPNGLRSVVVMEMLTSTHAANCRAFGLPTETLLLKASPSVIEEAGLLREPKA